MPHKARRFRKTGTKARRRRRRARRSKNVLLGIASPVKGTVADAPLRGVRSRGGLASRPVVQLARHAFSKRNASWKSFEVPKWFTESLGVPASLLRRKVSDLREDQNAQCLYARISYMLHMRSPRHINDATGLCPNKGTERTTLLVSRSRPLLSRSLPRLLRRASRHLLLQSDLLVEPY